MREKLRAWVGSVLKQKIKVYKNIASVLLSLLFPPETGFLCETLIVLALIL